MVECSTRPNASRNILAVGHTTLSVEGRCGKGRSVKQKACEIREVLLLESLRNMFRKELVESGGSMSEV